MVMPITHPQASAAAICPGSDPILRLPEVEREVGLKKTTIYSLMAAGEFPQSICLGGRARGWVFSEIQQWKRDRIAASRVGA